MNNMSYGLTHSSYFMGKMNEVLKWLEEKEFKINLSRYSKYKNYIDDFYKKGNPNDSSDLEERFKKFNDAVQECIQIVQIYDAFKNEKSTGFKERLQKIVYGCDFYNQKNKSDQPRDFLYELIVASWFKKCGYDINFDQLTDVVAKKNNITIYVECKRIKSINRLEENFKKACKQLSKVNDTTDYYGFIFIDIYNCMDDKIRDYEYTNVFTMRNEINDILENNFRKQNAGLIERILTKNLDYTLGVAFTNVRCLWLSNVTPQFYEDKKVVCSSQISDTNFHILQNLFHQ